MAEEISPSTALQETGRPAQSFGGPAEKGATEWSILTGAATDIPGGVRGWNFWALQGRWGRVLTEPHGLGRLRGSVEYAFEIVPAMVLAQDGALYGGGINPLILQFNFESSGDLSPFVQAGGGMLYMSREFPAGASRFNFTPQGGFGTYWRIDPGTSAVFGVRFHHISNSGLVIFNPGHNALYFYGGLSWWR